METASFAPGSVRRFLREAVDNGSRKVGDGFRAAAAQFLASIAPLAPANTGEMADRLARDEHARSFVHLGLQMLRAFPSPIAALRRVFESVARGESTSFGKMPTAARRHFRAVMFLSHRLLDGTTDEQALAAIAEMDNLDRLPPEVGRMIGLVLLVLFAGTMNVIRPETAEDAASQLWQMAAAGESQDSVEDAIDAADYWEAHWSGEKPVPFDPQALIAAAK